MVKKVQQRCKGLKCTVYRIDNNFFGTTVTVSGLITGVDLIDQLKGKSLFDELLISRSMLRDEGDLFLCQTSLKELEKELGVKVTPIEQDGASFVEGLLGIKEV